MYLWLKAFHLIFMVAWFAGLLYLPRIYVYHSIATDELGNARFKIMERKLYFGIMLPAATLTIVCGILLAAIQGLEWIRITHWFHWKLGLIALLIAYHFYLGRLRKLFAQDTNFHSHAYYRWINEFPVLVLVAVIVLAVLKPL